MISYNFLVCKAYFEKRALPLYNTIGKQILEQGDKINLLAAWSDPTLNTINVSQTDDYVSAIPKLINSFSFLEKYNKDADWFFFGDDDTFIHIKNLKQFLTTSSLESLEIHGCCYTAQTENCMHAHGGCGFVMNRTTLLTISDYIKQLNGKHIKHWRNSDVTLALNVKEYNQTHSSKIEFINHEDLFLPSHVCDLTSLDFSKFVAVHVVDRMPFKELLEKAI